MKTMKKNARKHNINKVIQELTAASGLHIDNEKSLKKNNKQKTKKIAIKTNWTK